MPLRSNALLALLLACAVLGAPRAARAQIGPDAAAPADGAQAAFRRGNEHAKAGKWAEAILAYEEAYGLRPAWDIAGNLGIAEVELGRWVSAAKHLDEALRGFPGSGKPEQRSLIEAAHDKALAKVGRLAVRTSVARATVSVDGVAIGVTPLAAPLFVEPGKHRVEARLEAQHGASSVEVAAGAERDVLIALADGSSTPPAAPSDVDTGGARPVWPAIVLGGVGVVGVGVGVGFLVAAGGASSDAEARFQEADDAGSPCRPGATTGLCAEAQDHLDDRGTFTAVGVVGLVGGGLAAAGALAYLLWPESGAPRDSTRPVVMPMISPGLAGATTHVRF